MKKQHPFCRLTAFTCAAALLASMTACGSSTDTAAPAAESIASSAAQAQQTVQLIPDTENKALYASQEEDLEGFSWYQYSFDYNGSPVTLHYRLFAPEAQDGESYPIVVACHGSGGLGSDNTSHMGTLNTSWTSGSFQAENPCYVLAIQMPANASVLADDENASADFEAACLEQYRNIIDTVCEAENNIDTNRIYLTGHSLGACYALNLMVLEPNYYAGALILAGSTVHSTWGTKQDVSGLSNENIYMVHGADDIWILPSDAQRVYDELTATGNRSVTLEFITMQGLEELGADDDTISAGYPPVGAAGHMVTKYALSDEGSSYMNWLFAQEKGISCSNEPQIILWDGYEDEVVSSGYGMDLDYADIGLSGSSSGNGTVVTGSGRIGADNDFSFTDAETVLHAGDTLCFAFKGYQGGDFYGIDEYSNMWTMEYTIAEGSVASVEVLDDPVEGFRDGQVYAKIQLADDYTGDELIMHIKFTTKDGVSYMQQIQASVE